MKSVAGRGYDTISFLSDYGHGDEFVGVVHSVIAAIAPHVRVVDVTHGIAPCNVRAGGLALARAAHYLLPGVVLAVVDPGVGTNRRPVAVEVGDGASVLIGPDNGLLAPVVALVGGAGRAVELADADYRLESPRELGSTFDGRDVFAPAAAHLCLGVPLSDLGPAVDVATLTPGMLPVSRRDGDALVAEVLWVDRFGNCQLNVDPAEVDEMAEARALLQVTVGEDLRTAERARAYADVPPGRVGLVTDSSGLVSLALPQRSAADELGLHEGSEVRLATAAAGDRRSGSPSVVTPVGLSRRTGASTGPKDQGDQP
ncbi:MAG: SAM-dependent chlorinase/fluorinase [Acidimicrobiaceae bacterium]|nr:SAM-dependent chlorinase/fluorinase [Acidimicrobiaceae bacterium]MYE97623.1 SAM-dependent chlorinase/fluorinase [Acidimicrobiaceae bacterium]MYI53345.1 SAM-dependent chlorinase/fluorinase [Acidimicrobiaceae bacterium]